MSVPSPPDSSPRASADESSPRAVVVADTPAARRTLRSVAHLDTRVLTLSPRFLEALERVAPRRKKSRLPLALGLALITVIAIFAADPSMRAFALDRGHRLAASLHGVRTPPAVSAQGSAMPALDPVLPAPSVEAPVVAEQPAAATPAPVVVAPATAKSPSKKAGGKGRPAQRAAAAGGRG